MALLGDNAGIGAGALARGFRRTYFPMEQQQMQRAEMERRAARQAEQDAMQRQILDMQHAQQQRQQQQARHSAMLAADPSLIGQVGQEMPRTADVGQGPMPAFMPSAETILRTKQLGATKGPGGVLGYINQNFPNLSPQEKLNLYRDIQESGAAQTTIYTGDMGKPGDRPIVDKPEKGMQRMWDPQTRSYRDVPIPGASVARGEAEIEEKAEAKKAQTDIKKGIVVEDINRIFKIMDDAAVPPVGLGSILSFIPQTDAANVARTLDTLKASVGFEALQQMRDASPTGGALGQVSEMENRLLQSALGSLDPSLSPKMFRYNLNRVKSIYLDTIHGPGNWDPKTGKPLEVQSAPATGGGVKRKVFNPATGMVE